MRLRAAEVKVLRSVVDVTGLECMKQSYKREIEAESSGSTGEETKNMWSEKILENEGSLVNRVMNRQVAGKGCRGRPRKRWRDES